MKTRIATTLSALCICLTPLSSAQANIIDDTTVKFSGYIKADAMVSQYSDGTLGTGSIGRDFYIPSLTPVGGSDEGTQFDAHIRQSRFRFTTESKLSDGNTIKGVLEMDFLATPNGNERISNSYTPRIRHAFIQYQNWIIGQTWSTFQDVRALPESIDFIGVTDGTIFARQVMVRYTNGPFEIALENPETTVTPNGGGGRIVADDSAVPDLTARYTMKGDWGYFAVAGLVRQLDYVSADTIDSSETSYGVNLTGKVLIGKDDVRFMANFGTGLGRYSGLNVANGAVLDANGELQAIDSSGFSIAYRHLWSEKWRSNFIYSSFSADNDVLLTGTGATKKTLSTRANIMYSPTKELTFGAEYTFAKREIESGLDGDMNRLQVSAKYAF